MSQEIADANAILQKRIDAAKGCISALQDYCSETQLKGFAYANSKMYYSCTYIPLLNQVIGACSEIISLNDTIVPTFTSLVPDAQGYKADTQIIEDKIKELRNKNLAYQTKIAEYRYWMGAPFSPDYSEIISWYENQIDTNNNVIIPPLEAIVEGLRAFNSACAGIYDGVSSRIQRLATAMRALGTDFSWDSLEKRFIIPPGVVEGIKKMELELLSQLGESDEKDIEIINTLFPDWNRQLEEAINSPFGVSQTISDEIVIPFPNGSSITYRISAKVNISTVSVMDINHNVVSQSKALNCSGFTFTKNGFTLPMASTGDDKVKVEAKPSFEFDKTGRIYYLQHHIASTKLANYSVTSSLITKQPLDRPQRPMPKPTPVVIPDPTPWRSNDWSWVHDKVNAVKDFANNAGNTVGESLRDIGSPENVCTVTAVCVSVVTIGCCFVIAL